jgi:hypothetical protein
MGAAMQDGVGRSCRNFPVMQMMLQKIMQMYLQKEFYGGSVILKTETVDKFNTCYYCGSEQ